MTQFINTTHDCPERNRGPIIVDIPKPPTAQSSWIRCQECQTCIPVEIDSL